MRFMYLPTMVCNKNNMLIYFQSACEMDSSLCGDNGTCTPDYQDDSVQCTCKDDYTGKPCSKLKTKMIISYWTGLQF